MKKLIDGIVEFREKFSEEYRRKFGKLATGQHPDALFVACCDSRVVPNTFASTDPGDLFVLRNIGNIIPPCNCQVKCVGQEEVSVSAAIEYSLNNLDIKDIIVCGHSKCGAMQALLDRESVSKADPCLNVWLDYAASSYDKFAKSDLEDKGQTQKTGSDPIKLEPCDLLSQINVLQQLDNLKTYPLVKERLDQNELQIHGWWFDIVTADVYRYDQETKEFVLIV